MARYTGPQFKLSRRLGISLSGSGKELKRPFPPGQHGPGQRKKQSGYGLQLQEKQKLRHMYGLSEKQFRNLFTKASHMKGIAGENFMILLESRLDNLVYRLGWANSRAGARQLVSHGHVTVNGKKVLTPAFNVSPHDKIKVDGEPLAARQGTRVWLYHKPAGLLTAERDGEHAGEHQEHRHRDGRGQHRGRARHPRRQR